MNRLQGKVALVTGGASGIGLAAAVALAQEGASVVVTDVDLAGAESAAGALGGRALGLRHDAGDERDWQQAISATLQEFGHLDVLVNNAGIGTTKSLLETSLADWRAVMRVNLDGVFLGTRFGIEAMRPLPSRPRQSSGSIINVSSVLGLVGMAEAAPYGASKGGVRSLTKAAALECAAKSWQVRVNSIHPGFIATPMVETSLQRFAKEFGTDVEVQRKGIADLHPLGRLGSAEEVAAAIVFLGSDEAAFVTGSELVVDGGYTAR